MTRFDFIQIINDNGYKIGAEVGVHHGYFSYYLLRHSDLELLYSIDTWAGKHGDLVNDARAYLLQFGDRSRIMHMASIDAARLIDDNSLDFVYIDANHCKNAVAAELQAWHPKIRSGGMVAGHDYVRKRKCGVIDAVDEFISSHEEQLQLTDEVWKSWWFIKI